MSETLFDRTRGIKGNRRRVASWCIHGKKTIKDEKPFEHCNSCSSKREKAFGVEDMSPHVNLGLGCVTYGTRDAERQAKKRGLTPIGDADFRSVAKSVWPDHPLTKKL
jgi:hypothetical protein